MSFDPFKKRVANNISLEERMARDQGSYPDINTGWDITFLIFYGSNKNLSGILLANHVRHIMGLPGTFLVFYDNRFRGVINWTSHGWEMKFHNPELVFALGEWIELYYQ